MWLLDRDSDVTNMWSQALQLLSEMLELVLRFANGNF